MCPADVTADRSRSGELEVSRIRVRIGGRVVLSEVSLGVRRGEIVAILGPNGAGKTSLLEAVAGFRPIEGGEVRFAGEALRSLHPRARVFAYMPDEMILPAEARVEVALGLDPASPFADRLGVRSLFGARGDELSRGESKRAQLCSILALGRPVLLLDEPFAAFDPRQLRSVLPVVRDAAKTSGVLVTIHQMHVAERVADRLLLLSEGRVIAQGTVDALRAEARKPGAPLDEVFLTLLDRAEGP